MTKPAEPQCNCPAGRQTSTGSVQLVHQPNCPVYEPQLNYGEIRQLRRLLKYLYGDNPSQAK